MISHKHKCIFIHIAKCAGTSIESAFGVDTQNYDAAENDFLFGWDRKQKIWLQHATPQELLDYNFIGRDHWNNYYKFIVYRNSWSRAYSDYLWLMKTRRIQDSFKNFITRAGKFKGTLNNKSEGNYAGDHLRLQRDYFYLEGKRINYDCEIDFDNIEAGFSKVAKDLSLPPAFFKNKLNENRARKKHYSHFYNKRSKSLVEKVYKEDINFFGFTYEEKKNFFQWLRSGFTDQKYTILDFLVKTKRRIRKIPGFKHI